MTKIVAPKEMARIESLAYRKGAVEKEFMENAGKGIALHTDHFCRELNVTGPILLLVAKGNNSGDAYVAGRYLLEKGYPVAALQTTPIDKASPLCRLNHQKFLQAKGTVFDKLPSAEMIAEEYDVILDGLFGTGFHGEAKEPFSTIIKTVNDSEVPIIAIDIPSGLNGETGEVGGEAIQAIETIYLGLPKKGFFLGEGWNNIGILHHVDFGLGTEFVEEASHTYSLITEELATELSPKIVRNRHKYQAGYVMGLGGSPGMPGAALLAASAALKGGAGMMRLLHPAGMEMELITSPYEVIKIPYQSDNPSFILENLNKATAAFFGPGIGRDAEVKKMMKGVLPHIEVPCVVDADALTLLSEGEISLPKTALLTPHTGEMARLLGIPSPLFVTQEFLDQCQEFVDKKKCTLVLKGGPSFIFHPGAPIFVNPTGSPGMATAGSGDVLTGLLAALLSQGLSPQGAALFGVYLHGLAGEFASYEYSPYSMIASDIIEFFPEAFWEIG